jgi:hypothetical protein
MNPQPVGENYKDGSIKPALDEREFAGKRILVIGGTKGATIASSVRTSG